MRLLELLFDQDFGVNSSTMAPWDFIQPKVVKTSVAFFLLKAGSSSKHTKLVRLCWSFGAEMSPKERNQLLKCTIVQHCGFHLGLNLHGLTLQVRSVTGTEPGDEVSRSLTAQNKQAICLNTEGVLRHMDSARL